jgi:hypothetical protein
MPRLFVLPRDVVSYMLPLGTSLPCRLVATVILAVVSGAAMASPIDPGMGVDPASVTMQVPVRPGA